MCRNLDLRFLLFYCLLSKFFFPPLFAFFLLSVLLSFLLWSNWFLFLSSFVFPLLFRYWFIPVSLAHVVSSLAYPNLLGTKRLGCWLLVGWLGKEDSPSSILIKKSRNHRSRSRKSLNPGLPSLMGRIQTAHSATAKPEGGTQ
jgi:hypothetical protein